MDIFEEEIRTGFEPSKEGRTRVGFERIDFRTEKDPKYLAAYNLNRALAKYPDFTSDARINIQNELVDMPDLAVMNLDALAAVLNFLKTFSEPTPEDFQDDVISDFFENLLPDKPLSAKEQVRFNIRLKAQFLKYIEALNEYRS